MAVVVVEHKYAEQLQKTAYGVKGGLVLHALPGSVGTIQRAATLGIAGRDFLEVYTFRS